MRSSPRYVKAINSNRSHSIDLRIIEEIAAGILKELKKEKTSELDIVFMDDPAIRKLNKRYKGEDKPTDVLSFAIDGREFGRREVLGEIFISLETARRNAKLFGVVFEEEIVRYVAHGILHLFGYDDLTAPDKARMWHKQEKLLGELCKQGTLSKVLTRR